MQETPIFGERLKLARKRSGLSLRALSSRIEGMVSAQAIGKYERGEMMPSSPVANALADALDVSMSYLLRPSTVSLESVEFRKEASLKAGERAAVEAEVLDHVERYLQIEEILGIAGDRREEPSLAPYGIQAVEDAEDAAEALRTAWNLGGRPIHDMTDLLEDHGIKVFKFRLPSSVDGITCHVRRTDGDDVPVIVCSDEKSIERQRFTIAHELGHLAMDVTSGTPEETACHRFAAAFLVPGDALIREVGRRRDNFGFGELVEIKQKFGISAAALVTRMRELGIIRQTTADSIFRGVGRTWKSREPSPITRSERPRRFRRLCVRALAEKEISESKAAELLRLPVSEIEHIMAGSLAR